MNDPSQSDSESNRHISSSNPQEQANSKSNDDYSQHSSNVEETQNYTDQTYPQQHTDSNTHLSSSKPVAVDENPHSSPTSGIRNTASESSHASSIHDISKPPRLTTTNNHALLPIIPVCSLLPTTISSIFGDLRSILHKHSIVINHNQSQLQSQIAHLDHLMQDLLEDCFYEQQQSQLFIQCLEYGVNASQSNGFPFNWLFSKNKVSASPVHTRTHSTNTSLVQTSLQESHEGDLCNARLSRRLSKIPKSLPSSQPVVFERYNPTVYSHKQIQALYLAHLEQNHTRAHTLQLSIEQKTSSTSTSSTSDHESPGNNTISQTIISFPTPLPMTRRVVVFVRDDHLQFDEAFYTNYFSTVFRSLGKRFDHQPETMHDVIYPSDVHEPGQDEVHNDKYAHTTKDLQPTLDPCPSSFPQHINDHYHALFLDPLYIYHPTSSVGLHHHPLHTSFSSTGKEIANANQSTIHADSYIPPTIETLNDLDQTIQNVKRSLDQFPTSLNKNVTPRTHSIAKLVLDVNNLTTEIEQLSVNVHSLAIFIRNLTGVSIRPNHDS